MPEAAARSERRKDIRVPLEVPVSVQYGHLRMHVGATLDASRSGAQIACGSDLSAGTLIALKNLVNQASTSALVVRSAGRHEGGLHRLGVVFIEHNPQLWLEWLGPEGEGTAGVTA